MDTQHICRAVQLETLRSEIRRLIFHGQLQGQCFDAKAATLSGGSRSCSSSNRSRSRSRSRSGSRSGRVVCGDYDSDEDAENSAGKQSLSISKEMDLFALQEDLCRFCDDYPSHGYS